VNGQDVMPCCGRASNHRLVPGSWSRTFPVTVARLTANGRAEQQTWSPSLCCAARDGMYIRTRAARSRANQAKPSKATSPFHVYLLHECYKCDKQILTKNDKRKRSEHTRFNVKTPF
jgi:hypothetical protein